MPDLSTVLNTVVSLLAGGGLMWFWQRIAFDGITIGMRTYGHNESWHVSVSDKDATIAYEDVHYDFTLKVINTRDKDVVLEALTPIAFRMSGKFGKLNYANIRCREKVDPNESWVDAEEDHRIDPTWSSFPFRVKANSDSEHIVRVEMRFEKKRDGKHTEAIEDYAYRFRVRINGGWRQYAIEGRSDLQGDRAAISARSISERRENPIKWERVSSDTDSGLPEQEEGSPADVRQEAPSGGPCHQDRVEAISATESASSDAPQPAEGIQEGKS